MPRGAAAWLRQQLQLHPNPNPNPAPASTSIQHDLHVPVLCREVQERSHVLSALSIDTTPSLVALVPVARVCPHGGSTSAPCPPAHAQLVSTHRYSTDRTHTAASYPRRRLRAHTGASEGHKKAQPFPDWLLSRTTRHPYHHTMQILVRVCPLEDSPSSARFEVRPLTSAGRARRIDITHTRTETTHCVGKPRGPCTGSVQTTDAGAVSRQPRTPCCDSTLQLKRVAKETLEQNRVARKWSWWHPTGGRGGRPA